MAKKTSVVTPERFKKGFAYKDWLAQIKVNQDRFERWYTEFQLKPEDARFFKQAVSKAGGPAKVLAIGEDWCPDVYRGMPIIAKIAEASGMELKVFPRDLNLDIADEFLNKGEFRSIPTLVFYTKDHRYIAHWIERPASASKEQAEIAAAVNKEFADKPDPEKAAERRKRLEPRFTAWQQESVRELRELISKHI